MIAIAEEILGEIEAETVLLNGEVVRRAFEILSKPRDDNWDKMYPPFCCLHAALVAECKKAESIAESAQRRVLDPVTEEEKRYQHVWLIHQNRFSYAEECRQNVDALRARIGDVWPCLNCFKE